VPWYVACLVANAAIMGVEYANRTHPDGWLHALRWSWPLIIVAQWSLYTAWSSAPNWLLAWAVFAIGNSALRVVAVYFGAGDEVDSWALVLGGITLMLTGSYIVKEGLT